MVMRGRFLLLFVSAMEAGVAVVPMTMNYVFDDLLVAPPTSLSSSARVELLALLVAVAVDI